MGSSHYRPKPCLCGSGLPATPQIFNGVIVGFACETCQSLLHLEIFNNPFYFPETAQPPEPKTTPGTESDEATVEPRKTTSDTR